MIGALGGLAAVGLVIAVLHGLHRARWDAVTILTLFAAASLLLPARLVFPGLGAWGTPAAGIGVFAAGWWLLGRLFPWIGLAKGSQSVRVGIYALAIVTLVGYAVAMSRPLSGDETGAANRALLDVFVFGGVVLLAADGIESRERLETLLRRICLFGAVIAGIGAIQYISGFDPVRFYEKIPIFDIRGGLFAVRSRGSVRRVVAMADHPIEFGVVVALLFPIALHYARFAKTENQKIMRWAICGVIGAAIPMSVSRSALLAVTLAVVVLAFGWTWRQRLNALIISVAYLAVMRAITPGLLGTLRNLITNSDQDNSITARTRDFEIVIDFFERSPITGRGVNTFLPTQYPLLDNQWLRTAIELGVVGVLTLALVFACGFFAARSVTKQSADAETRDLAQTLAAIVLGAAGSFITYDAWFYRMSAGVIALAIGCAGALARLSREERSAPAAHAPPFDLAPV